MQNFVVSFRPIHYRGRLLRARALDQFFLFLFLFSFYNVRARIGFAATSVRGIKFAVVNGELCLVWRGIALKAACLLKDGIFFLGKIRDLEASNDERPLEIPAIVAYFKYLPTCCALAIKEKHVKFIFLASPTGILRRDPLASLFAFYIVRICTHKLGSARIRADDA